MLDWPNIRNKNTRLVFVWAFSSDPKKDGFLDDLKIVENSIQKRRFSAPKPVSKIKSQNILEKLTFGTKMCDILMQAGRRA